MIALNNHGLWPTVLPSTITSYEDASSHHDSIRFCGLSSNDCQFYHLPSRQHTSFALPHPPTCVAWSPDGEHVVVGDTAGHLHFCNKHGTLLFSQQVFKPNKSSKPVPAKSSNSDLAVVAVTFVGATDRHTMAATSGTRLFVFSRLNLAAFEAAAKNDDTKEVTKVRRRARIASKDLTKYHGQVLGMASTCTVGGGPRIFVFGSGGAAAVTAWTVGKSTKLQLKLMGTVSRASLGGNAVVASLQVLGDDSSQVVVGDVRRALTKATSAEGEGKEGQEGGKEEGQESTATTSTLLCWDSLDLVPIEMTTESTKEGEEQQNMVVPHLLGMVTLRHTDQYVVVTSGEGGGGVLVQLLRVDVPQGTINVVHRMLTPAGKKTSRGGGSGGGGGMLLCNVGGRRAWCVGASGVFCLSVNDQDAEEAAITDATEEKEDTEDIKEIKDSEDTEDIKDTEDSEDTEEQTTTEGDPAEADAPEEGRYTYDELWGLLKHPNDDSALPAIVKECCTCRTHSYHHTKQLLLLATEHVNTAVHRDSGTYNRSCPCWWYSWCTLED